MAENRPFRVALSNVATCKSRFVKSHASGAALLQQPFLVDTTTEDTWSSMRFSSAVHEVRLARPGTPAQRKKEEPKNRTAARKESKKRRFRARRPRRGAGRPGAAGRTALGPSSAPGRPAPSQRIARSGKPDRACSRLYRSQNLQVNMRWN